jgi:hypothetical protein
MRPLWSLVLCSSLFAVNAEAASTKVDKSAFDIPWHKSKEIKPGTCYEASASAAIRRINPKALSNVFKWNEDGSLVTKEVNGKLLTKATFFSKSRATGEWKPVEVNVDLKPVFTHDAHDNITKRDVSAYKADVLMLEAFKSFRLSQGRSAGWKSVAEGGMSNHVLSAVLGGDSQLVDFSATKESREKVWAQLDAAAKENRPITVGAANGGSYFTPRRQQALRHGLIDKKDFTFVDAGVVDTHAYTYVGQFEKDGVRYVRLRNPWGNRVPPGESQGFPGAKRGFVNVTLDQFTTLFTQLYIGPQMKAAN